MNVHTRHPSPEGSGTGSRAPRHAACGTVGFALVVAAFAAAYAPLAVFATDALGLLSSITLVWSFLVTWFAVWVAVEAVLALRASA